MSDNLEFVPGRGYRKRLRYGKGLRARFLIATLDEATAERRGVRLQELANLLARSGHSADAPTVLTKAASATNDQDFNGYVKVGEMLAGKPIESRKAEKTFQALGEDWTSGRLHAKWPDHVKVKRSADLDEGRLEFLYKTIGKIPLSDFKLEDAERAMAALDPDLSSATRRQYAQLISKLLKLAVYPCKIIDRSPLPLGFLPTVHGARVTACLYPDEDAALLAWSPEQAKAQGVLTTRPGVPLLFRVLYGFLAREGLRLSEALGLRWKDVDLVRGGVTLDTNKTDDPRSWALSPGVAEALKAFKPDEADGEWMIFAGVPENRAAETFRAHLAAAGIDRHELFEETKVRRPIRVHDLRATFVTLSLANGKSESWVSDRTGHKSSVMINRYKKGARKASELGLGGLASLVDAIPELRARALAQAGTRSPSGVGQRVGQADGPAIPSNAKSSRFDAVPRDGIEPPTRGFSILCSTN
jgi:integrase